MSPIGNTQKDIWERDQIPGEGCQKAITGLSAQATPGTGILLGIFNKLSSFKEIQVETDCCYLKGVKKEAVLDSVLHQSEKSDLAGRGK